MPETKPATKPAINRLMEEIGRMETVVADINQKINNTQQSCIIIAKTFQEFGAALSDVRTVISNDYESITGIPAEQAKLLGAVKTVNSIAVKKKWPDPIASKATSTGRRAGKPATH